MGLGHWAFFASETKMKNFLTVPVVITFVFIAAMLGGCGTPPKFATGYSTDENPEIAARMATEDAITTLGSVPVKGLVFVVYYPKDGFETDKSAQYQYSPDEVKERIAAETIAKIAADIGAAKGWASRISKHETHRSKKKDTPEMPNGNVPPPKKWEPKPDKPAVKQTAKSSVKKGVKIPEKKLQPAASKSIPSSVSAPASAANKKFAIPNIGFRARGMTQFGTLKRGVAVLAIGGHQVSCRSYNVPIFKDRYASARQTAVKMQQIPSLKLVLVLSEMQLSFGTDAAAGPEDFIRGMMENLPRRTVLLGGNSMNIPGSSGKKALEGMQFNNGTPFVGQIVTMGIGGPVRIYTNHISEFRPVEQVVTVTGAVGNWVTRIDGAPAAKVYRKLTGMADNEFFSRDCRHGVGVVLPSQKMYVRMIRNWVNPNGRDSFDNVSPLPPGSLRFDSPIVVGTQMKILYDEGTINGILDSAKLSVQQSLNCVRKTSYRPALVIISDCCTRDMRRRFFGGKEIDEAKAITGVMKPDKFPLFGFYAFGQIGPIEGSYRRMNHQFQQHTIISALIAVE